MLIICGTPDGCWAALAQALKASAPPGLAVEVRADALAASTAPRCIAFIDSPTAMLARAIEDLHDPELALCAWRDSAQHWLTQVLRRREQILLIDTTEAFDKPAELLSVCGRFAGQAFAITAPSPVGPVTNPLVISLASSLVRSDPALQRLHAELEAACAPLGALGDFASSHTRPSRQDSLTAIEVYRATRKAAALHEKQAARLAEIEQQLADARNHKPVDESSQQENQLLLLQLHQVQEELEQYYFENERLRQSPDGASVPDRGPSGPELVIGHPGGRVPHRHLNLTLRTRSHADGSSTDLALRLVDHGGTPGLLLFAPAGQPVPLRGWVPTGEENGRPYMLIHPGHRAARVWFEGIDASDWMLVNDLSRQIDTALHREGLVTELASWRIAARRIRQLLADQPPALRYDRLQAQPPSGDACVAFVLDNVHCGDRHLLQLHVGWSAGRGAPQLEFRADPESLDGPPLSVWGVDADGRWQPTHAVRFGSGLDKRERRRQWTSLGTTDRALIEGLLLRLQRWADAATLPAGVERARASVQAASMLAEAREAQRRIGAGARRSIALLGIEVSF